MSCCDDPTEIHKVDPRELIREQQHYGNLVRDLFTDDPEKVLFKLLKLKFRSSENQARH